MSKIKIFESGRKPVNVSLDIYNKVEKEAKQKKLLPSQVVNQILKEYFDVQKIKEEK